MRTRELKTESGLHAVPIAKVTDCYDTVEPRVSLTESRVTQGIFIFIVLACLGVAHVYLRFSIQDMKSQQRDLQVIQAQLDADSRRISQEIGILRDPARLREATQQLDMKETDPRTQKSVVIPPSLVSKYATDSDKSGSRLAAVPTDVQTGSSDTGIVEKILAAIFDADGAYARDKAK